MTLQQKIEIQLYSDTISITYQSDIKIQGHFTFAQP